MRLLLATIAASLAAPAYAGLDTPPVLTGFATTTALNALASQIPVAADVVPPMETVAGAAGATMTFRRGDAVQPRITRTASCTLVFAGSIGSCDATWDGSSFPNGTTIRLAGAPVVVTSTQGLATEQPITCKAYGITITGITITGISFRCWSGQTTALNLTLVTAGLTLAPFIGTPAGATVQVTAIPSS